MEFFHLIISKTLPKFENKYYYNTYYPNLINTFPVLVHGENRQLDLCQFKKLGFIFHSGL